MCRHTESFLEECTTRLGLPTAARRFFTAFGEELHDMTDARLCHEALRWKFGRVLGPLWVTQGDALLPEGLKGFAEGLLREAQQRKKDAQAQLARLEDQFKHDPARAADFEAKFSAVVAEMDPAIAYVSAVVLPHVQEYAESYVHGPDGTKFDSIPKIRRDSILLSEGGIRITVRDAGTPPDADGVTLSFNLREARRGLEDVRNADKQILMKVCCSDVGGFGGHVSRSRGPRPARHTPPAPGQHYGDTQAVVRHLPASVLGRWARNPQCGHPKHKRRGLGYVRRRVRALGADNSGGHAAPA